MTGQVRHVTLAAVAVLAMAAASPGASLYHKATIDLGPQFNSTSGYGDNPLSIAFDGTNAYVGGYKSTTGSPATVGVVKVENVLTVSPVLSALSNTQFTSPHLRGIDALSYHAGTGSLLMAHDSGTAASSFISRRNAGDGSIVWTVSNPQSARPWAMAVDTGLGGGGGAGGGVAFLVSGSGRRRLLDINSGANVYDGTNGGVINTTPTSSTNWRAMAFDSDGNIVVGNQDAYGYGVRNTANQWKTLTGTTNLTTRSDLKNVSVNNVGQGIVIMEGIGLDPDFLALSGRGATSLTDSLGGVGAVLPSQVHIRNLNGSATGLTQLELTGGEDGVGTPWLSTSDIKNLAFGRDALGNPVLLVVDFNERRLDVYVPEPATLMLLGVPALWALRRRSQRAP